MGVFSISREDFENPRLIPRVIKLSIGGVRQDAKQNQHFSYEDPYLLMNKVLKNNSTRINGGNNNKKQDQENKEIERHQGRHKAM